MAAVDYQFSDHFDLGDRSQSEWFDPFLNLDTGLFVDPFLIYGNEREEFVGAHDEIISFFKYIFEQIAQSAGNKNSAPYIRAINCLTFPEMEEACLGLTAKGTHGAGSGIDIARQIAAAIWTAIEKGTENLSHFEEVQIFGYGIGPDRISDATLRILLWRFARYTQRTAEELGIPCRKKEYSRSRFDISKRIWISDQYRLPENSFNGKPIILVPKRYLKPFPTLNHEDFWQYCREREGVALSEIFGSDVIGKMPKEDIVAIALEAPELRSRYIANRERTGGEPYDFDLDPRGFVKWYEQTKRWVENNAPKVGFHSPKEFPEFVETLLQAFRHYVEEQGGWGLLWNENETAKREDSSQRLLLGIISQTCVLNGIDISKENNIGRGPVDFKLSAGGACRALIEIKLARNTKFWNGLEAQLPTYLRAEGVNLGWFLIVVYDDKELNKISAIKDRVKALNERLPYDVRYLVVDADHLRQHRL